MSDNTLTAIIPSIIANGLPVLREAAVMPQLVTTDFRNEVAEKGQTITFPFASAITAGDVTPAATPVDPTALTAAARSLTLSSWKYASFKLSDKQMSEINDSDWVRMQTDEAMRALAYQINSDVFLLYKDVYGYAGTAATNPFATNVNPVNALSKVMTRNKCPLPRRNLVLDVGAEEAAKNLTAFNAAYSAGDQGIIVDGALGRRLGYNMFVDQQVPTHTAGTITTGLITKASTVVAIGLKTLVGTTAASTGACALVVGDVIAIAGHTTTYVVTATATQASAATDVTITIEPGLEVALAGSEAITVKASHVVNLGFDPLAFGLAFRPMAIGTIPNGFRSVVVDQATKIPVNLEITYQYHQWVWEFSVLYGKVTLQAARAARLAG